MGSLWIIILSLTVLEVSALTPGPVTCQIIDGCCVCGQSDLHSYCSTVNGLMCAPDDFDNTCRTNPRFEEEHILPDDWELMLDSHDYQNLVADSGPAWIERDMDGDGGKWSQRGGVCQYDLRACSYTLGQQNNWVFSQHIKYPPGSLTIGTTEIFLNITFRFSQCTSNPACTNDFVTLHRFDTNATEPTSSKTEPTNYIPLFGPETETMDSRLKQVGSTDITVVRSFRPPGDYTGFYLGIRDTGTCGQVKRIFLYYEPCKKMQKGLVNCPEVVRPPAGSGPNIAEACCAPNSHNTTSRTVRAHSNGTCECDVMCESDAGYRLDESGTACIACLAGTYRSLMDPQGQCLNCPMNTVMEMVAAPICPCIVGYFRDTTEGPGFACTCPPNPVLDLRATQIGNTSITVTWTRPEICRTDFYYIVEYSDPDNFGNFLPATGDLMNKRYYNSAPTVTYRVPTISSGLSLRPYTDYTIRVTVHNGVSDQDSENEPLRRAELQNRTREGIPSVSVNVQPLAGVIVWGPPAEPNGVILGYNVSFYDSSSKPKRIIPKGPSDSYHLVTNSDIAGLDSSNTFVQVSVNTSAGRNWSEAQPYTGQACPTPPPCPTDTCPTPPPCPTDTCPTPPPCPTDTSPTPLTCPTTLPPDTRPTVKFMLGGKTYLNNTIVLMSDIGEDNDALLCMTDRSDCCDGSRVGEFYYPDNTAVGFSSTNSLYRNRGPQVVRLNRRGNALSPTGVYRCQIPDSIGRMQNIYINIIADDECPVTPVTECPTTTTSTPMICTCPESTPCPTCATCPTIPEPTTCPTPTVCPTTPAPCPTTPTPFPSEPDIKFMLRGKTYLNNTIVLMSDIGETDNALLCMTDRTDCCSSPVGEFYYPDNTAVGFSSTNSLYRNRDTQVVRLNRKNNALSPTGVYRCEIPDSSGRMQNIYINIIAPAPPCPTARPPCPTTSTPVECPTVTTIATTDCPTCPATTDCPTVVTPTTQTTSGPSIKFVLDGITYLNNTIVLITDIGEDNDALLCMTVKSDCCRSSAVGEFYYPNNNTAVGYSQVNSLYRNRDTQVVRLNRRNNALSPTGVYRCQIPDSSGRMQNIYINIIAPQPECPTSTCPVQPSCPTTSTPTECPPITTIATTDCQECTCPTTSTPTECPVTTQMPSTECPTCPTTPTNSGLSLKFMLGGKTYLNNTIVLMSDIGEDNNALLCMTDKSDCCSNPIGEFYYPNNSAVGYSQENLLYRNRGPQVVRLNRRNNDLSPTGVYRCQIPDSSGSMQSIYINIIAPSGQDCPTTCPPPGECPTCPLTCTPSTCTPCETVTCAECPTCTPCPTICPSCPPIKVGDCTVSLVPIGENTLFIKIEDQGCRLNITEATNYELRLSITGTPSRKRQANRDVTIQLNPGQTLVDIPREYLQEGSDYTIQAQLVIDGREVGSPTSPETFTYTASGELSGRCSDVVPPGYVDATFVALAIVVTFILTAIIVALLVIVLTCLYITCKVKTGYYSINNGNGVTTKAKNPYDLDS